MKDIYNVGEVFLYKNGTIVRIVSIYSATFLEDCEIKLRCIRPVKGLQSDNVGQPYTYQRWTTLGKMMKDKPKRIGTEEILLSIFENKRRPTFFQRVLERNRQ